MLTEKASEAVRCLGFAARFVSGYIYVELGNNEGHPLGHETRHKGYVAR